MAVSGTLSPAGCCAVALLVGYAAAAVVSCGLATARYGLRLLSPHDAVIGAFWLLVFAVAVLDVHGGVQLPVSGRPAIAATGLVATATSLALWWPAWLRRLVQG